MARAVLRMLPGGRLPPLDLQTLVALAQEWGPVVQELLPGIAVTGETPGQPLGHFTRASGDEQHLLTHNLMALWAEVQSVMPAPEEGCWGLQPLGGHCSGPSCRT